MSIRNHTQYFIDFLRLPRPQGERRTDPDLSGELDEVKINLLPLGYYPLYTSFFYSLPKGGDPSLVNPSQISRGILSKKPVV